jgi:hypothetical protein
MVKEQGSEQEDASFPSPKAMSSWLDQEIADIHKAAELRIRDATRFVTAYSRGDITPEETEQHNYAYSQRWGDVVPGVTRTEGLQDEEILKRLDETRIRQGLLQRRVSIGEKGGTQGPRR